MEGLADKSIDLAECVAESLVDQETVIKIENIMEDWEKSGICGGKNSEGQKAVHSGGQEAENSGEDPGSDCSNAGKRGTEGKSDNNWVGVGKKETEMSGAQMGTNELTVIGCGEKTKYEGEGETDEGLVELIRGKTESTSELANTECETEVNDGGECFKTREEMKNMGSRPKAFWLNTKKNGGNREGPAEGETSGGDWLETVISTVEKRRRLLETDRLTASKSGVSHEGRRVDEERFLEDLLSLLMSKEDRPKKMFKREIQKPDSSKLERKRPGNKKLCITRKKSSVGNIKGTTENTDNIASDTDNGVEDEFQNDTMDNEMEDSENDELESDKIHSDPDCNKGSSGHGEFSKGDEVKKELQSDTRSMEEDFNYQKDTDRESNEQQTGSSVDLKFNKIGGAKKNLNYGTGNQKKSLDSSKVKKRIRGKDGLARRNRKKSCDAVKRRFQCSVCDKTYSSGRYLRIHMASHTGVKEHACHLCDKAYARKCYLQQHLLWHAGIRNHECNFCHKRFLRKSTLEHHMTLHTGKKLECPHCDKRFTYKSQLVYHSVTHTGIKNFQCMDCGKRFATKMALDLHAAVHLDVRNYMCDFCGKLYKTKTGLKIHRCSNSSESNHANRAGNKSKLANDGESNLTNLISNEPNVASFVSKSKQPAMHVGGEYNLPTHGGYNLPTHVGAKYNIPMHVSGENKLTTHIGAESNLTTQIGIKYSIPTHVSAGYNLPTHISTGYNLPTHVSAGYNLPTHIGGEANLSTQFIGSTQFISGDETHTIDKPGVRKDCVTHPGDLLEKRFKCDYCPMSFSHRGNLNKHLVKHTGNKDYKCQMCGKAYRRSSALRRHCLTVHPEEYQGSREGKFACERCGKVFRQKNELAYHWNNIHSMVDDPSVVAGEAMCTLP